MEKLELPDYPTVKTTLMICLAVSTENQRVTDGQKDRRRDIQTNILRRHSLRYAYASCGKNWYTKIKIR